MRPLVVCIPVYLVGIARSLTSKSERPLVRDIRAHTPCFYGIPSAEQCSLSMLARPRRARIQTRTREHRISAR